MLEYLANDGQTRLLAMLQAYVANQGDGWTYSLEYLRRHLEQHRTTPASDAPPPNAHEAYLALIRVLALRTAELHRALCQPTADPAFSPQPLGRADIDAYRQHALDEAHGALDLLAANLDAIPAADRERAIAALAQRERIVKRIEAAARRRRRQARRSAYTATITWARFSLTRNDFVHHRFRGRTRPQPGASGAPSIRRCAMSPGCCAPSAMCSTARCAASRTMKRRRPDSRRSRGAGRSKRASAFLSAYDADARGTACTSRCNPGQGLLGLFELEKALYELRYEIGNRPTWVGIPLQGILDWGS